MLLQTTWGCSSKFALIGSHFHSIFKSLVGTDAKKHLTMESFKRHQEICSQDLKTVFFICCFLLAILPLYFDFEEVGQQLHLPEFLGMFRALEILLYPSFDLCLMRVNI